MAAQFDTRPAGKKYYRHFLRLNNRRKSILIQDLVDNQYPCVKVSVRNTRDAYTWASENLPEGSWIRYWLRFYFATEEHRLQFKLVWG